MVERLLVKYHNIFPRRRLYKGINNEIKRRLTLKQDEPVYAQNLPMPTNLQNEMLVEFVLQTDYGMITTLLFNQYSLTIFAQRKPNGRLMISLHLRRINHLIKHDYNGHNLPVTTFSDATQLMTGKKYFCKLDCSKLYHCLQMTDEQSVQLLSINCGSHPFAYRRLAEGSNSSLSAFNSFVRKYLDPVVKADRCAQYFDGIGVAAHTADKIIQNVEILFQLIELAGTKLSMSALKFGQYEIEFLGKTVNKQGIALLLQKSSVY